MRCLTRVAGQCFVIACTLGSLACGIDGPAGEFPLPPGAPPDVAAPAGTTNVLITTVDMLSQDGTPTAITMLRLNGTYRIRLWVFCPRGQAASVNVYLDGGGGREILFGEKLAPGYNVVQSNMHRYGNLGSLPYEVNIYRPTGIGQELIASKQFALTVE